MHKGFNKIIHRTDRCDLSLFQLGLRLLDYFLDHEIPIPVYCVARVKYPAACGVLRSKFRNNTPLERSESRA